MNYLGGTYVSQVNAHNQEMATRIWIQNLDVKPIKGFSEADKRRAIQIDFKDDPPVPIKGVSNVWFFLVETKKGYGHVNLIRTDRNSTYS